VAILDTEVVTPAHRAELVVAYTPMTGWARTSLTEAFVRAGFSRPAVVSAQAARTRPSRRWPFPNPEEPGAMDLVLETGHERGADIADRQRLPDADRCAVAVSDQVTVVTPAGGCLRGD